MDNEQDGGWQLDQRLRATAEAKLIGIAPTAENCLPPHADVLWHELRVHQIELEMQNEELRRAHTALETSRDRYVQLYDFAPVCYLTLTHEGLIAEANLTCVSLLGVARKHLLNRRFASFVMPGDSDRWHRHFLHARQHGGKHRYELGLHRTDGAHFHALLDCLHSPMGDGQTGLHVTLTDITERKQVEESLRIAAAAFETQEGIIVTGADKRILRVNRAFCSITGYSADEVIGRTPSFLHSGLHGADFHRSIWIAVASDGCWQGEIWDRRKNGEVWPLRLAITTVADEQGGISHYVGSFTDISAQKQAEKILLEARGRLENQVATTTEELEKIKQESADINAALNVLLKHRETDKSDAQNALSHEMEATVLPFLKKLKKANPDRNQTRLITVVEANLQHLVKAYGRANNLYSAYQRLSPVETQVAAMVRQGLPTKLIAATLNLSPGTVCNHRKHIRKKLGLDCKAANLHGYLVALVE